MALNDIMEDAAAAAKKTETEVAAKAAAASAEVAAKARKEESERASEIVAICAKAGEPAMAASLIRDGSTLEQAKAKVEGGKAIREAVALARKSCPQIDAALADQMIAAGASIETVRADLFEKIAAVQNAKPTRSAHQATTGDSDVRASWDKVVDKVNARHSRKAA